MKSELRRNYATYANLIFLRNQSPRFLYAQHQHLQKYLIIVSEIFPSSKIRCLKHPHSIIGSLVIKYENNGVSDHLSFLESLSFVLVPL